MRIPFVRVAAFSLVSWVAVAAGAQTLGSVCGGCSITYTWDKTLCSLVRRVDCSPLDRCFEIPGWNDKRCQGIGSTGQNGIADVTAEIDGTAKIYACTGQNMCETEPIATCDISYYKPKKAKQPQQPGDSTEGGVDDPADVPRFKYECIWEPPRLRYRFQNFTPDPQVVTWGGTPFLGENIPGNAMAEHLVQALEPPRAVFTRHSVSDLSGDTDVEAVTFRPNGACDLAAGDDYFTTPANGATFQDFGSMPIPADFFAPGSEPFTHVIWFQGRPLQSSPPNLLLPSDTIVRRLQSVNLAIPGYEIDIPIEIVALSLVSIDPITVTYNGGVFTEQWNVSVHLSAVQPQVQGSMTVRAGGCPCAEGGTFTATLPVLPRLVFSRIGPPAERVLDFGQFGLQPVLFSTLDGHWLPFDPGFGVLDPPAGILVDHDGLLLSPPVPVQPNGGSFFAGLRAASCSASGCDGTARFQKRLTHEQAMLAAHAILPAQICADDADGDGFCDDADNCANAHNPLQEDADQDGVGDACDNCVFAYNPCQEDWNGNGVGVACDPTDVSPESRVPDRVALTVVSRNPVSDMLAYRVSLPRAGHARVRLFDAAGRLAGTLLDAELQAGHHDFARSIEGEFRLASGVYVLRLEAAGARETRKVVVMR